MYNTYIRICIYILLHRYVEESSYGRLIYEVFGETVMSAMRRNSTKLLWFQHNSWSRPLALGRPVPGTHQGVEKTNMTCRQCSDFNIG